MSYESSPSSQVGGASGQVPAVLAEWVAPALEVAVHLSGDPLLAAGARGKPLLPAPCCAAAAAARGCGRGS